MEIVKTKSAFYKYRIVDLEVYGKYNVEYSVNIVAVAIFSVIFTAVTMAFIDIIGLSIPKPVVIGACLFFSISGLTRWYVADSGSNLTKSEAVSLIETLGKGLT